MKHDYEEKRKELDEKYNNMKTAIEEKVNNEFNEKISEIKTSIYNAQTCARDGDFDGLKNFKFAYVNQITQGLYLFGSQPSLMADIVNDLEKALQADMKTPESNTVQQVVDKIDKFTTVVKNDIIKRQSENTYRQQMEYQYTLEEIDNLYPRDDTFDWLKDEKYDIDIEEEEFVYFTPVEIEKVDLQSDSDKIYLIKWKNLSYLEATWEPESILDCPPKINDFRIFNRALDKESRSSYANQLNRHKNLLEIMSNPKKKQKIPPHTINDWKKKLYMTDKNPQNKLIIYNQKNQPIFKEKRILRPYQVESLNWLVDAWYMNKNVILADEMG